MLSICQFYSVPCGIWQILLLRFSCLLLKTAVCPADILVSFCPRIHIRVWFTGTRIYWFDEGLGRFSITDDTTKLTWHVSFFVPQTFSLRAYSFHMLWPLGMYFNVSDVQVYRLQVQDLFFFWDPIRSNYSIPDFCWRLIDWLIEWSIKQCCRTWGILTRSFNNFRKLSTVLRAISFSRLEFEFAVITESWSENEDLFSFQM